MQAPAVSFAKRFVAAALAALLTFTLLPANAFAEGEGETLGAEGSEGAFGSEVPTSPQPPSDPSTEVSGSTSAASSAEAGTLAASLMERPVSFVNADVALDGEPVVGSFTIDGLTFAVTEGSDVELVGAAGAFGSEVPTSPQLSSASTIEDKALPLMLPESVIYNDVEYSVTSIGAYAFYLSGVTSVELTASVVDIDDRAFRSSDVALVEVAEGNTSYSSFDGALYDADQLSLLLIPEGKQGTVLLPKTAESAAPSVFSHCPLVTQISVEEGSAAFASENGLLYDASLTTLLRVPAGATDITIRDGCTTIAAGALEACASLATINAPASVISISPDVFTSVPTISLPAASVASDGVEGEAGTSPRRVVASNQGIGAPDVLPDLGSTPASPLAEASDSASTQLTALVALSSTDNDLPEVNPAAIEIMLPEGTNRDPWSKVFFTVVEAQDESASLSSASVYASYTMTIYANGHTLMSYWMNNAGVMSTAYTTSYFRYTCDHYVPYPANISVYPPSSGDSRYAVMEAEEGWKLRGFRINSQSGAWMTSATTGTITSLYAVWAPCTYTVAFDLNGGAGTAPSNIAATYDQDLILPALEERHGYKFLGWNTDKDGSGTAYEPGAAKNLATGGTVTLYAQWERVEYDLGFDVDSEPGDEDYPGIEKPDETVNVESGPTVIEDPKRPGYVFQGWTIPNVEGTEAIDQELVYQDEADGKWYVDASKLPDYANDEGRVELTARWTSVISVDVPSAVTFYADVVTQGNESREGAASSAFGQSKVASQSRVDLRIVGLESEQVQGNGSTALGASDILSKKDGGAVSGTADKLFSLYPTSKALTPDDLQDPDAVSAAKPADAVDFALDDILLERSFAADKFTIPAGDTLNLGYRLNLSETGTELDYDKLSTLDEGQSASIANISYCFAADYDSPADWGEPLWIENPDTSEGAPRFLVLDDIKAAAEDLSAHADDPTESEYYKLYAELLDRQVMSSGNPGEGPYFQLKVEGAVGGYLDLQLVGICQDYRTVGGKAGLTFQLKDVYAYDDLRSTAAGGGAFKTYMYETNMNGGSWQESALRNLLRNGFAETLDDDLRNRIVTVVKFQQIAGGTSDAHLQMSDRESIWVPSLYEVYGAALAGYNESEPLSSLLGFEPFQYMAYQGNDGSIVNARAIKTYNSGAIEWWTRTPYRSNAVSFSCIYRTGQRTTGTGGYSSGVAPAFCL